MPLSPACSAMLCVHSIDAEPAFAPSASMQHHSCIVPAPVLHRSCIDACACLHSSASMQHPYCIDACICLHSPASMLVYACILLHRCSTRAAPVLHRSCIDACVCLHSPASFLHPCCIDACVCLHPPASMLAPALHRFCIRLHRTEPTKGEARRLVRFSDQRIESTCETCDGTRGARTRAHPRPSSVLLRSFVAFSFLPVPPPSSFVLSRPFVACLVVCPSLLRPPSFFRRLLVPPPFFLVLPSPALSPASSFAIILVLSRPCLAVALVGCAARFLTPVVQWNWRRGKPSPKLSGIGPHGTTVIAWLLRGNPPQGFKSRRPASPVSCHSTTHA